MEKSVVEWEAGGAMAVPEGREEELKAGQSSSQELVTGNDEGHLEERLNPMLVFPEEIWRMIFGYLDDPNDLKNCYFASVQFQPILEDKKQIFLFQDVMNVLISKAFPPELRANPLLSEPPRVRPLVSDFSLLNYRLVCQGWKKSVDNLLQQDCPFFPLAPEKLVTSFPTIFARILRDNERGRVSDPDINPMPSRYLIFSVANATLPSNCLTEFLQMYGQHVWYFKVDYESWSDLTKNASLLPNLKSWLLLMPNLKSLYIRQPLYDRYRLYFDVGSKNVNKGFPFVHDVYLVRVRKEMFPHLESMKNLVLEDCPPFFIQLFLEANPHIEKLMIKKSSLNSSRILLRSIHLEKLTELSITHYESNCEEFEEMSCPNLRKLTYKAVNVPWIEVFQAVRKNFEGSLIELNLELAGARRDSAGLHLPNLERLNLKISRCFFPIGFISHLKSLKHLTVELCQMTPIRNEGKIDDKDFKRVNKIKEKVKIQKFTHDLKNSNIWRLFPKLEKVMAKTDRSVGQEEYGEPGPHVSPNWQSCTREEVPT